MRAAADNNAVSVKAYAGTTGVLLAFDVRPDRRDGLVGFAIERGAAETDRASGCPGWVAALPRRDT